MTSVYFVEQKVTSAEDIRSSYCRSMRRQDLMIQDSNNNHERPTISVLNQIANLNRHSQLVHAMLAALQDTRGAFTSLFLQVMMSK